MPIGEKIGEAGNGTMGVLAKDGEVVNEHEFSTKSRVEELEVFR